MIKTLITFLFVVLPAAALAQTIIISTLTQAPQIDGQDSDWDGDDADDKLRSGCNYFVIHGQGLATLKNCDKRFRRT